jgi:hypothetical protein
MGISPGFQAWVEEKKMDKVYICEECTNEIPFSEEAPQPCQCGAEQSSWVVAEKPERRCGGEAK